MEINRSLLPIKGHFFLYWGFMASAPPFVMVVARQMGVPLAVQGVVSAVVTAAAVLARPLIAALVDTFSSIRKIIFLVLICLMMASYNPLGYLPPLQPPPRLSGSLLPPPPGLDTPYLVVYPHHHHHRHHHQHHHRHRQDSLDECVVTSAWDCFASPDDRQENEESPSDMPDFEVRFSIRLIEEGRHKSLGEGENGYEEGKNRPSKRENKLEEGDSKLGEVEDKFEKEQNTHTRDYKVTVSYNELREEEMVIRRQWGLDSNEILLYEVEGPSEWHFTNVYNVSVGCLGGELGTVGDDGAVQEGNCGPAVLKEAVFWVYVMCLVVSYISATTVESISDAICCDSIGEGGHYGRQRVWGVLSYGLLGAVSGMLVDWRSGECTVRDYRPAFLLMTACGALDLLLSAACLKVPRLELQRKGVWTNLRPLLRRVHFLVFLVTTFLTGFFDGLDTGFLFVLQEDIAEKTSNASNHVNAAQGLALLVQAIAAIPFMFLGDWFVRRFSAEKVINAVLFLYSIRLLSLSTTSYFKALWGTVVIEVINGPCFGLGYTAIVVHAAALAPRGLSTTVQSVVGVCYGTLGYAGASFVGGVMYEMVGGQWLYLLTGAAALVTWALHLAHLKLCPPDIKAAKFEMAEAGRQEEPEVLQVMVQHDRDTNEAAQREGGGTEGELLKKKDGREKEAVEKRKDKGEIAEKGKNEKETVEKGKEEKEEEESVKKEKEIEVEVVDYRILTDRKASEKSAEGEKKEKDEEKETDTLLKNNSIPIRGEERKEDDIGSGEEGEGGKEEKGGGEGGRGEN